MHLPAGWTAKNIIGFLFCCVVVPGLLIWRVETGDNPDRTFGFFWGGWTAGGFTKGLYELIRARGAFRRLVFDEKRSKHKWWIVPLLVLMGSHHVGLERRRTLALGLPASPVRVRRRFPASPARNRAQQRGR